MVIKSVLVDDSNYQVTNDTIKIIHLCLHSKNTFFSIQFWEERKIILMNILTIVVSKYNYSICLYSYPDYYIFLQLEELGSVLKESNDVESLVLRNSGITDRGMRELNRGLQNNKSLKVSWTPDIVAKYLH